MSVYPCPENPTNFRYHDQFLMCRGYHLQDLEGMVVKQKTGLGGFEPPASGLEARRYVQAKPQAHGCVPITFALWDN